MKNPLGGFFFPWMFKESQMWREAYLLTVKPRALKKGKNTRLEWFYNKLFHALNKVLIFVNNVI